MTYLFGQKETTHTTNVYFNLLPPNNNLSFSSLSLDRYFASSTFAATAAAADCFLRGLVRFFVPVPRSSAPVCPSGKKSASRLCVCASARSGSTRKAGNTVSAAAGRLESSHSHSHTDRPIGPTGLLLPNWLRFQLQQNPARPSFVRTTHTIVSIKSRLLTAATGAAGHDRQLSPSLFLCIRIVYTANWPSESALSLARSLGCLRRFCSRRGLNEAHRFVKTLRSHTKSTRTKSE